MSKFRCELSEGGTSCGLLDFFPFHLCLSVCDDCPEQKHQGLTFVLITSAFDDFPPVLDYNVKMRIYLDTQAILPAVRGTLRVTSSLGGSYFVRRWGGCGVPTLDLRSLGSELGLDLGDTRPKLGFVLDAPLDSLHPVHDGGVVTAVEELSDGLVGGTGVLLDEVHHDLTG